MTKSRTFSFRALRTPLSRLVLPLAFAVFVGCASLTLVPPEITLVDLGFTDLTLFETSGHFTVRLANENPGPLSVEGGVYSLYLGGLRVGKGLSDRHFEIPPLTTATDKVDLHVNHLAMAARLKSIYETGIVEYEIRAKIYVGSDFGRRTLTAKREGRYDFHAGGDPVPGQALVISGPGEFETPSMRREIR